MTTTIGNHGKDHSNYRTNKTGITLLLQNISVLVILLLCVLLKERQLQLIEKVDEGAITPADFTLVISNIHKAVDEQELREFIVNAGLVVPEKIVYVNYGYAIGEYIKALRTLNRWEQKQSTLKNYEEQVGVGELPPPTNKLLCCWKKKFPPRAEIESNITRTRTEIARL